MFASVQLGHETPLILEEKKIDRSNRCSAAGLSLHSQSWISYQKFLLYLSESSSDMLRPVSTEMGAETITLQYHH